MDKNKEIDKLYKQASDLAIELVIEKARLTMKRHPKLIEYCQGMGTWFFCDKNDNLYDGSDKICRLVDGVMQEWDDHLGLTGHGMRFTVDGPVVTKW